MSANNAILAWKAKENLKQRIQDEIALHGRFCSLNHLDLTGVTDMSELFAYSSFNGDISQWDVSQVKSMSGMFKTSFFNGDISQWDVSNVNNMSYMFMMSQFKGDISNWRVSNVGLMHNMFEGAVFSGDLSRWDVAQATDLQNMFEQSSFNGNVSGWKLNGAARLGNMFKSCPFQGDFPEIDLSKRMPGTMVDEDYRGRFNNRYDLEALDHIFGSEARVQKYVRTTADGPLDRVHFETLTGRKTRPGWISEEVFQWAKAQQLVLDGLGMPHHEMGAWMQSHFAQRGQPTPSYSVDALML